MVRTWASGFVLAGLLATGSGCTGTMWGKDDGTASKPSDGSMPALTQPISSTVTRSASIGLESATDSPTPPKTDKLSKGPATVLAAAFRNQVDFLPDPTKDYQKGPGIVGQVWIFDKSGMPVEVNGTLTVWLFDETKRLPGQPGLMPECYEFTKDVLKTLHCKDERFGRCYQLFLPWPTYRPDVTQARITVRYDADGRRLLAPESNVMLVPSGPSGMPLFQPGEVGMAPAGYPSPSMGWGSYGMGNGAFAMGTLNPNSSSAAAAGWMNGPLGMIGSHPTGAPAGSIPAVSSTPMMPYSGSPMSQVPLSAMPR